MGDQSLQLKVQGKGWLELRGKHMWFMDRSFEIAGDGSYKPLDLSQVQRGQTVGVYFEHLGEGAQEVNVASFLETSPAPSVRAATMETSQLAAQNTAAAILMFPVVAGLIGLFIGAADGLVCRLWRRALVGGGLGFLIGFIGGFVTHILANLAYTPLSNLAVAQMNDSGDFTAFGFSVQLVGRGVGMDAGRQRHGAGIRHRTAIQTRLLLRPARGRRWRSAGRAAV